MRMLTPFLTLAIGACMPDRGQLTECSDGTVCPDGTACAPAGGTCVDPDQLTACDGRVDGDSCDLAGALGTCDRGVCIANGCGDGVKKPEEACDDGNNVGGDGCSADCQILESCGNGVVDDGEDCDDANTNATDRCDACRATTWVATPIVGASSAATEVGLANPPGVTIDREGRILIADSENNRVQRIDGASITTIAGTGAPGYAGDGGPASSAQLYGPQGIAVDGIGRIYIADGNNNCIRLIDELGMISTIAGACGSPYAFYTVDAVGDGGSPLQARFAGPTSVAVDGQGRVYIADSLNHAIRRMDGNVIERFAGTGTAGSGGDGTLASTAQLNNPIAIALDTSGNLYIADRDNQAVRKVGSDGALRTIAGVLETAGELAYPSGVAVSAGGVITIADSANNRIRQLTGTTLVTVAGDAGGGFGFGGDSGPALGALLASPAGVAVDATGRIVIADTYNQRIRRVDVDAARTITTIAGSGAFRVFGDGAAATSAPDLAPWAVAADAQGNVYIADGFDPVSGLTHDRIRKVDTAGTITTLAGNGDPTSSSLPFPEAVAVDALGRVYMLETATYTVWRADANGLTKVAGGGVETADGKKATETDLTDARSIAIDGTTLYVSQYQFDGRVRAIANPDGTNATIVTVAGGGADTGDTTPTNARLEYPRGMAFDATHRLYIADASRILRVTPTQLVRIAGVYGDTNTNTGEGVSPLLAKMAPLGLAIDATGNIYYSDAVEHRVRKINNTLTSVTTFAGARSRTYGAIGDGGPATGTTDVAKLFAPHGLAFDAQGRLLIADRNNHRVRRVDTNGTITTIAGAVAPESMGMAARARFRDARSIATMQGMTLVAGGSSGTVQLLKTGWVDAVVGRYPHAAPTGGRARFRADAFGTVAAVAADAATSQLFVVEDNRIHQVAMTALADPDAWMIGDVANTANMAEHADGNAATARFRAPAGIYVDGASRALYIADTGNHVIRAMALDDPNHPVTTIAGTPETFGFMDGTADTAKLYSPSAVTRCPNGDLFIADTGTRRVRRLRAGVITTVLGTGLAGAPGEGAPSKDYPVDAPKGLACDATNNLYVASTNTIRQLPANAQGEVDGTGEVLTIYKSTTNTCLTGLHLVDAATLHAVDQCSGQLVELERAHVTP